MVGIRGFVAHRAYLMKSVPGFMKGFHKKSAMRVALVEIDEGRNHRPIATWNRSVLTGEFFPAAPPLCGGPGRIVGAIG